MVPLLAAVILAAPLHALELKPHPIVSERRLELTREYCRTHYGLDSAELKDPQIVVVHATEVATLAGSFNAFKADTINPDRKELAGHGEVNVGVHFLVDYDGTVYSLLPLDVIGRHAIGLNHVSIGIENVGSAATLTRSQVEADADLIKDLVRRRPTLRYLIGHHEYTKRALPHYSLWKELDAKYRPTVKSDPGPRFMDELRTRLQTLGVSLAD